MYNDCCGGGGVEDLPELGVEWSICYKIATLDCLGYKVGCLLGEMRCPIGFGCFLVDFGIAGQKELQ